MATTRMCCESFVMVAGRFLGSVYIDPRLDTWRETLTRFAGEGFRCVKMWPPIGFYPDEPRYYKVFEAIETLGLPVLFHVGLTGIGREYDSKYADPLRIEALLRRFPGIHVVLAHWGGLGTWQMAWAMMKAHDNVFLDASARDWSWPGPELHRLYEATTPVDFGRVLWGTDNLETPAKAIDGDCALLGQLGKERYSNAFFGGNAARLLHLE